MGGEFSIGSTIRKIEVEWLRVLVYRQGALVQGPKQGNCKFRGMVLVRFGNFKSTHSRSCCFLLVLRLIGLLQQFIVLCWQLLICSPPSVLEV